MKRVTKVLIPVVAIMTVAILLIVGFLVWQVLNPPKPSGQSVKLDELPKPKQVAGDPATDPRYAKFYDQKPDWANCFTQALCAGIEVPVDWSNPDGPTLNIGLVKLPARDTRRGALLMNPGGPGASGVKYVGEYGSRALGNQLLNSFDIVGFDPRGVGRSAPADCLSDQKLDELMGKDIDKTTKDGFQKALDQGKEFVDGCQKQLGPQLKFMSTEAAAKDMDVVRAVNGDERTNYFGKSYGTLLGATYANLYPHRVGRMVLDGGIDPKIDHNTMIVGQAKGMDQSTKAYLAWCLKEKSCPFSGSADQAYDQLDAWLNSLTDKPIPSGDAARPITRSRAIIALISAMYTTNAWPNLSDAIAKGKAGDGAALLGLYDQYMDRAPDGSYATNLMEAYYVIHCSDYYADTDFDTAQANAKKAAAASRIFGTALAYGEGLCGQWPVPRDKTRQPLKAVGAPPILVVGNEGDPATPYEWSRELAKDLESGHLLTFQGEGHTAYAMPGAGCVNNAVENYLLGKEIPEDGGVCTPTR